MATILNSTMFPPIVETYAEPFIYTTGPCKVPFTMSSYQTVSNIKSVQISVAKATNNQTALDTDKYPCEIMIKDFSEIYYNNATGKGYVTIKKDDMANSSFILNAYYKIQIRFCSCEKPSSTSASVQNDWLNANLNYFSEWSSVAIAYGISAPELTLSALGKNGGTVTTSSIPDINGKVKFEDGDEEKLESYSIILEDNNKNELEASGEIKTDISKNGTNEIYYSLKYDIQDGEKYIIIVKLKTNSGYIISYTYYVTINLSTNALTGIKITAWAEDNNGCIKIQLQGTNENYRIAQPYSILDSRIEYADNNELGNPTINNKSEEVIPLEYTSSFLTIRRTSNLSNYKEWEDFYTFYCESEEQTIEEKDEDGKIILTRTIQAFPTQTFTDYTVEAGVFYLYAVQTRDAAGGRGALVKINEENKVYFDPSDIFFIDETCNEERILKLKYNMQISSFKENVQDTVTTTLGSKYPYVLRNGYMYYKTFSLSGLLSIEDIDGNTFFNEQELYNLKNDKSSYNTYYNTYNVSNSYNYMLERFYREKVMEFLYNDSVKLYKSLTEGNILCRVTEVSLTPKQTLGRLIWDFSCTVTEVDDFNLDNCVEYNIHDPGEIDLSKIDRTRILKYGQVEIGANTGFNSLKSAIESKLSTEENKNFVVEKIIEAKLEFLTNPRTLSDASFAGYYLTVADENSGDVELIVNWDGIYEFYAPESTINDLSINNKYTNTNDYDKALVTYYISGYEEDVLKMKTITLDTQYGQLYGAYNKDYNILSDIATKYNQTILDDNFNEALVSTFIYEKLHIEASPGTEFEIIYNVVTEKNNIVTTTEEKVKYEINPLGVLEISCEETSQPISLKIITQNVFEEYAQILLDYKINITTNTWS